MTRSKEHMIEQIEEERQDLEQTLDGIHAFDENNKGILFEMGADTGFTSSNTLIASSYIRSELRPTKKHSGLQ
ncbi:hypothetical protein V2G26_018626 [Clonostachys chloroleuca]